MPLPKHKFPTYQLKLPASEQKISYRPWVSVEHKKLLTALVLKDESNIQEAMIDILEGCTFNQLNIRELPVVDFEVLFINVKAKSKGEKIELTYNATVDKDGVDQVIPVELDLMSVEVTKFPNREIYFSDGLGIKMKFPTVETAKKIDQETDDFVKIALLVDFVFDKDNIYSSTDYTITELADWLKGLVDKDVDKLIEFFKNLPTIKTAIEFTVGIPPKPKSIELRGLSTFFL